jgi:hypothetical protein
LTVPDKLFETFEEDFILTGQLINGFVQNLVIVLEGLQPLGLELFVGLRPYFGMLLVEGTIRAQHAS